MPRDVIIDRAPPNKDRRVEDSAVRVRELLGNYRNLDHGEREEFITGYRALTPVEIALLRSDEGLADNLKRFRADHQKVFRMPFRQYAALLAVALFGLLVCIYAMMFGS